MIMNLIFQLSKNLRKCFENENSKNFSETIFSANIENRMWFGTIWYRNEIDTRKNLEQIRKTSQDLEFWNKNANKHGQ